MTVSLMESLTFIKEAASLSPAKTFFLIRATSVIAFRKLLQWDLFHLWNTLTLLRLGFLKWVESQKMLTSPVLC